MKSSRILIIGLLVCLCFGFPVYAQQVLLDRPILERVTVDPLTGDITIEWDMETPPKSPYAIEEFVLFWHETYPSSTNHPFDTIPNPDVRTYTFSYDAMAQKYPNMPDPRKTSVAFSVGAENRTEGLKSLRAYEDYNIQVTSKYDSCRAEIRLDWHPYKGWLENTPPYKPLLNYHVMHIPEGGGPHVEVRLLSDKDTFCIVPLINENDKYSFYIKAERGFDGMISTSYKTSIETVMPVHPKYVIAEGTQYNSDGLAEISFKIDPGAETHKYEFSGSGNSFTFISLGEFNIHGDTTLTDIQPREHTYYYRLEAWHVCNNKYTASSNTATALWLTLKQEAQTNLLQWDPYLEWEGEVLYELHRQIGSEPEEIIPLVNRDDLSGIEISGDVCYWLTARPASPTSSGQIAVSNKVCVKPESDIWIPKAFIPNSDGLNREWKPFFSYPPQNYLLVLYDRNGAKVYETKNSEDAWNGQLINGKPAGEGVYVYFLRFETAMGRIIEKWGTFSLILL